MPNRVYPGKLRGGGRKIGISQGNDEKVIELGAIGTTACIVLLLVTGGSLATSYFMIQNPDCFGGGSAPLVAPGKATNRTRINTSMTTVPAATTITPPPGPAPTHATTPPPVTACTVDQESQIKKQLPPVRCVGVPAYTQDCSFTIATRKGGCTDNTVYYREPIGQTSLKENETFTALFIGSHDHDDTLMDLLSLGSHDKEKYSAEAWRKAVGQSACVRPEVASGPAKQKARVFVLETDEVKIQRGKQLKAKTGLSDTDVIGDMTTIASTKLEARDKTLNEWAQTAIPKGDVHYMRIHIPGGKEADILSSGAGGGGLLERVWYLEFGYDWKGGWAGASLKPLIDNTLKRFACYWHGTNGNLWRITGCWMDYYDQKHWAALVCVNIEIEAAKPIHDKMEQVFQGTLQKDLIMKNN